MADSEDSVTLAPRREKIRVLHVDDDAEFLELSAELLEDEHEDIEVVTETTASNGLDRLEAEHVDCVVSDYDMPGMDGLAFLEAVRDGNPELPFVLFTGKGSEEVASEALSAGATDYLQKKGGLDQFRLLANRVSNYVDTARAESQRRRQLEAIETAQEGISILDEGGTFVYVNQAYADLYGYEPAEMVGEDWTLTYPDEEIDEVWDEIIPTLSESSYWRGETTGLRADGSTFLEDHTLAQTETGELICTVRDKTGEKRQQAELDASRRRFEAVFNDPQLFVQLLDTDGTIRRVNDTVLDTTPLEEDDIEGRRFFDGSLWGREEEEIREIREWVSRAAAGEYVPYEFAIERSNGTQFLEGIVRPVRDDDGSVTSLIASARDITDRTEYESQLTDLHAGTRELVGATDRSEVAEIATRTANEVLHFPMNGVHFYDEDEEGLVPVAVSTPTRERLGEPPVLDGGLAWEAYQDGTVSIYADVRQADGGYNDDTPMRSEMFLPLGEHGVFIVSSTEVDAFDETDVTLAKILASNAESALDRVQREQELQQRTEQLDEFVSVVSHDLRNPLNTLSLSMDMAEQTGDEDHFDRCHRAIDRMETLVEDLLTLAQQGEPVSVSDTVDVGRLVENCWRTVETADADLVVESSCVLEADEGRLQQLFENLVRNAVEHGGEDVTVTVGCLDDGFYVADDGVGIPEDLREEVFEGGFSTADSGTGFGLRIVRDIVDAHGWSVAVGESAAGGARFEVTGADRAE